MLEIVDGIHRCSTEAGELIAHPLILDLFHVVRVALTYQATTFRGDVLAADYLSPEEQYIVDGTLVPCWTSADRTECNTFPTPSTGWTRRTGSAAKNIPAEE